MALGMFTLTERSSGILLPITSLPSPFGIGDLGPTAYRFADFLKEAKQSNWQVLPLNPPASIGDPSPYNASSGFAGNTLLVSPELLFRIGLLTGEDIDTPPDFPDSYINYKTVADYKTMLFDKAYCRFSATSNTHEFMDFCARHDSWLADFALFSALRKHLPSGSWSDWPKQFRERSRFSLKSLDAKPREMVNREKFLQYMFFKQWSSLKSYCNERGIKIIGDMPFYTSHNSAEVWGKPHLFKLTSGKKPKFVSGVPPDVLNRDGQCWGHPVYDWQALKREKYSLWVERLRQNLGLFDVLRMDHFRGFVACWEVSKEHQKSSAGRWVRAPKDDFFRHLFKFFPRCPIIAEDLGHITPAVRSFIDRLQLPGMRVLLYGFSGNMVRNIHSLRNHTKNCVLYTGNHDSNTVLGWFDQQASREEKERLLECLGKSDFTDQWHWEVIELAMSSKANLVIIPMQDVLGLGGESRMNRPGTDDKDNWNWRLIEGQITPSAVCRLRMITTKYGRA